MTMDKLTKGTWIIDTVKHLTSLKQNTSELVYFEATEQAGKAGILLSRLVADKQEMINIKPVKILARASSISPAEIPTYLRYLKSVGQIDFTTDTLGNPKDIEVYCFSNKTAIETTSDLYEKISPREEEEGNLLGLSKTSILPCYYDEPKDYLITRGIKEQSAESIIQLQEYFGLVRSGNNNVKKLLYNEYSFNENPLRIKKALDSLNHTERLLAWHVLEKVSNNQGSLDESIIAMSNSTIIRMMEGVGLLDGITVQSPFASATFFTTPQLKGQGVGKFNLSTDVFHKAKVLLSCLRFGQIKSISSRGKISTTEKMINIIDKLLRGEWVGPATAIGQDYALLETNGVIKVREGDAYGYEMKLRQREVGELVRQMILYNKIIPEADKSIDYILGKQQPISCIIPEARKAKIFATDPAPVKSLRNRLLIGLRTGGRIN